MHLSYLYDIDLPSPAAAGIQILHTARALCDRGITVDLWVRSMTCAKDECLAHYGVSDHSELRMHLLPRGARAASLARSVHARLTPRNGAHRHVVMSRGETGVVLLPTLAGGRRASERIVYEAHRLAFAYVREERTPRMPAWRRPIQRVVPWRVRGREAETVRSCDGLVCLTEGVRSELDAEFRLSCPVLILPSGTSLPEQAPLPEEARDIDVAYAGKLERRKGIATLIEAARGLGAAQVHVVGGTPAQVAECEGLVRAAGVGGRLVLHGHLPPPGTQAILRRAKVGVCPLPAGVSRISDRFTSPLKILEMMAWACRSWRATRPPSARCWNTTVRRSSCRPMIPALSHGGSDGSSTIDDTPALWPTAPASVCASTHGRSVPGRCTGSSGHCPSGPSLARIIPGASRRFRAGTRPKVPGGTRPAAARHASNAA